MSGTINHIKRCQTPFDAPVDAPVDEGFAAIVAAVSTVNDPEYPDVSIVDLGLLESVELDGRVVKVGLVPTFSGCPALGMIADDVRAAIAALPTIDRCEVTWLSGPAWTTDRIDADVVERLSAEYTVVVRDADGGLTCPVCGSRAVADQSMAGPTRCRSVAWCPDCRNPVEVMRVDTVPSSVGVTIRAVEERDRPLEVAR